MRTRRKSLKKWRDMTIYGDFFRRVQTAISTWSEPTVQIATPPSGRPNVSWSPGCLERHLARQILAERHFSPIEAWTDMWEPVEIWRLRSAASGYRYVLAHN